MSGARELRLGVVGLGFGANHARVLSELDGVCLAAVCDSDADRLAAAARGRTLAAYADYGEMLRKERLDAVVVAVPAHLHAPVALAAIGAGCALLVEKPLAPSAGEAQRIVAAAEQAGVALMAGHIERFNPAVAELVRRVRAGEAGRVLQVSARRLAYFREAPREVDVGVIHDLALHEIDMMRFVLGAEVERAYAETQGNVRTPFDDSVSAVLRFRAAGGPGAVGYLEVNWLSPSKVRELSVLGEHGQFVIDYEAQTLAFQPAQAVEAGATPAGSAPASVRVQGRAPGGVVSIPIARREPLASELAAFVAAVRDGGPMPVNGADALAALAVADALAESGRTGAPVRPRWES